MILADGGTGEPRPTARLTGTAKYGGGTIVKFAPGNSGRRRGSKNRRTIFQRETLELLARGDRELPSRHARLKRLLLDPDPAIRLAAERLLLTYEWQRPPLQLRAQAEVSVIEATLADIWKKERERLRGKPGTEAIDAQLAQGTTEALPAFELSTGAGADHLPKAWEEDEWNPEPWRWIRRGDLER
jgi:hypothetical protein